LKILITGTSGFVGSHLIEKWKDTHTLFGLERSHTHREGLSQVYTWDELEKIPEVHCIIHLAGKAHDTKHITDEHIYN
jgi:NAD dependent epimerase/dehydratase family enzyme